MHSICAWKRQYGTFHSLVDAKRFLANHSTQGHHVSVANHSMHGHYVSVRSPTLATKHAVSVRSPTLVMKHVMSLSAHHSMQDRYVGVRSPTLMMKHSRAQRRRICDVHSVESGERVRCRPIRSRAYVLQRHSAHGSPGSSHSPCRVCLDSRWGLITSRRIGPLNHLRNPVGQSLL